MGPRKIATSAFFGRQAQESHSRYPGDQSPSTPDPWPEHIRISTHPNQSSRIQFVENIAGTGRFRHTYTYFLTMIALQVNKVLKQLLYHGKKTVPATVRRDVWTPYFSIHFSPNPAGALEGLFAFQKLRELSTQRQLSPTNDLIRATQEDIDIVKKKLGSPTTLQEMAVRGTLKGKIPKLNEILPKKLRARKMMDQKATSVADVAFVLEWILSGPSPWERVTQVATNRAVRAKELSMRSEKRLEKIREEMDKKAAEIRRRALVAYKSLNNADRTSLHLSNNVMRELAQEYQTTGGLRRSTLSKRENLPAVDLAHLEEYAVRENRRTAERQETAKAAEREELEKFFKSHDSPTTATGSVWDQVSVARKNALDTFDTNEKATKEAAAVNKKKNRNSSSSSGPQPDSDTSPVLPEWAESSSPRSIKMYWSDMNDGLFAPHWPRSVVHGPLAPFGLSKPQGYGSGLREKRIHIMGRGLDEGWVTEKDLAGSEIQVWESPLTPKMIEKMKEQEELKRYEEQEKKRKEEQIEAERQRTILGRVRGLLRM